MENKDDTQDKHSNPGSQTEEQRKREREQQNRQPEHQHQQPGKQHEDQSKTRKSA